MFFEVRAGAMARGCIYQFEPRWQDLCVEEVLPEKFNKFHPVPNSKHWGETTWVHLETRPACTPPTDTPTMQILLHMQLLNQSAVHKNIKYEAHAFKAATAKNTACTMWCFKWGIF